MSTPRVETPESLEIETETTCSPPSRQQDENLLRLMERNIASLKRETMLGTHVDPSSIRDLERQYRELAASLRSRRNDE